MIVNSSRTRDEEEEDVSEILGQSGREERSQENRGTETVRYGTPRWIRTSISILAIAIGSMWYFMDRSDKNLEQALASTNESTQTLIIDLGDRLIATNRTIEALREQLDVNRVALERKTNELTARVREEQRQNDEVLSAQIGQVAQTANAGIGAVAKDLTGAKTDIAATAKDLADTKARLTSTRGDLGVQSGLIAHTREDLEALKRLGDRNIFDFNLTKAKTPQRVGPIQMRLTNADAKKNRYTVLVTVDDRSVEKKDRTVAEPVQFLVRGTRAPYEVVVMEVSKDRIVGYLSTPK